MADPLPPLGGLSLNDNPAPDPPPLTTVRDLPLEITDEVLASYLARLELEELCEANLLQICMLLRGTNQCNDPDDPLWKAACARFGLTERLVGGTPDAPATPTWHVTFLAMCKEVATLRQQDNGYPYDLFEDVYKGLLRGGNAYYNEDFHRLSVRSPEGVVKLWLHAVFDGLLCMVHYLLRRVDGIVDINNGGPALTYASENGHLDVVKVLLAYGADVHANNGALWLASRGGHLAVVEVLLARGANVHADNDRALSGASRNGHLAVVEVLLAHGADVHADDDCALRAASASGNAAVVQVLLAHGADVHANDDEALVKASGNGHLAVVEVLLAHGADVHARDYRGMTALTAACRNDEFAIMGVLLAAGADVDARDEAALTRAYKLGHLAPFAVVVEALARAGATE